MSGFSGPRSWQVLAASGVQATRSSVNGAGDATETAFATVTVPANAMGANGLIRVLAVFDGTDSANSKTYRIRWNWVNAGAPGTTAYGLAVTTSAGTRAVAFIFNRNATNSQTLGVTGANNAGYNATTTMTTSAVDTTAAITIAFTSAWAGATSGETLSLESYIVELFPQT